MFGHSYYTSLHPLLRVIAPRLDASFRVEKQQGLLTARGIEVAATVRDFAPDRFDQSDRYVLELFATPAPPGLPRFHIYLEGLRSFVSKLFGGQDIELGVGSFDIRYMVKGGDEDRVRRCLTPERCSALVAVGVSELRCRGDRLELSRITVPGETHLTLLSEPLLEQAIGLMFDLAGTDVYGASLLAGLPDARFRHGALPHVVIAGPGDIRIGFTRHRGELAMEARAEIPDLAELPDRVVDHARALGAEARRTDGGVAIAWPTVVADEATLIAAIELLRGLVRVPRGGVFR